MTLKGRGGKGHSQQLEDKNMDGMINRVYKYQELSKNTYLKIKPCL